MSVLIRTSLRPPWWRELHPLAPWRLIWQQRSLLGQLIQRELKGRYRGSLLGSMWSVLLPVLAVVVYTLVFGMIFKQRWPGHTGSGWSFALVLFAGLAVFNAFAEVTQRATSIISAQPSLVKRVVFPLEILPATLIGTALMPLVISLGVVCLGLSLVQLTVPHMGWVLMSVFFFLMWLQGLAWFLSAVGTFLRDLGPMINALCPLLMFTTPIFYPIAIVPEAYQYLLWVNPLAVAIETIRHGFTGGCLPPWWALWWYGLISVAMWQLGFLVFARLRPEMADVV